MAINGKTQITGIIGWPIEHTLSPAMHNRAFESLSINYCYLPFAVKPEELRHAVRAIKALNFRGVNVTVPHKESVIKYLDEIDPEALFIGAVNTIVNEKTGLIGYNTDGRGFMMSLAEHFIDPTGMDILIVGAGGAARAVGYSLIKKAKSINVCGRTRIRAKSLVNDLCKIKKNVSVCNNLSDAGRFHMVIQATPLGLNEGDPLPIDVSLLKQGQVIYDLIYKKTRLLELASQRGCNTINGLGMLIWQGLLAFELWTGISPDAGIMKRALLQATVRSECR